MRRTVKQPPLKIRGSMTLTGDLDKAVNELKKEREQSLERLVDRNEKIKRLAEQGISTLEIES